MNLGEQPKCKTLFYSSSASLLSRTGYDIFDYDTKRSGSVTSKIEASAALLSHTGSKYKPHDVTYKPPQAGHTGRLVCYPGGACAYTSGIALSR